MSDYAARESPMIAAILASGMSIMCPQVIGTALECLNAPLLLRAARPSRYASPLRALRAEPNSLAR